MKPQYHLPHDLVLDYAKWQCGCPIENQNTRNYHGIPRETKLEIDGFECCLGQFSKQCPLPSDLLVDWWEPTPKWLLFRPVELVDYVAEPGYCQPTYENSDLALDAVQINDCKHTTVAMKVVQLQTLFVSHVIWLKNFPSEILEEIGESKL